MAQVPKIIDLTKSFIPVDGRAFPENLYVQKSEDYPVDTAPVVAYQGYNFLPTAYGYKSYFGTNAALGVDALTSKVDKIFIFQTQEYKNLLIALCEDGIWVKSAETAGAWDHQVVLAVPDEAIRYDWTYCVIEKGLYCYRANGSVVYFLHPDKNQFWTAAAAPTIALTTSQTAVASTVPNGTYNYYFAVKLASGAYTEKTPATSVVVSSGPSAVTFAITTNLTAYSKVRVYRQLASGGNITYWDETPVAPTFYITDINQHTTQISSFPDYEAQQAAIDVTSFRTFTPSFLNMIGQHGIFRSGQRLGFWDSENSVAWSSIDDLAEFTPSIETLAGSAIFGDVTGRITSILPHGEGFVIYSKGSIVWVRRNVSATFQWDPMVILTSFGVAFPEEICVGNPDTVHYAWTNAGLYKIENGKPEIVVPEVTDFLKDMQLPLFMELLQGRFLCLQLLDPNYVDGKIVLSTSGIPPFTLPLLDGVDVSDLPSNPITVTGNDACNALEIGMGVHSTQGAMQEGFSGAEAKRKGKSYAPVYRAYFSQAGCGDPDQITWGASPCSIANLSGTPNPYPMSPITQLSGKLDFATQTLTNKVDGGTTWDPLQFYSAQIAIWQAGDARRKSLLETILARSHESSLVTLHVTSCTPTGPTESYCDLGDWIAEVSAPHWGINECSFWVTRYVTAKMHIQTYSTQQTLCNSQVEQVVPTTTYFWSMDYDNGNLDNSGYVSSISAGLAAAVANNFPQSTSPLIYQHQYGVYYSGTANLRIFQQDSCPVGYHALHSISVPVGSMSATVIDACDPDVPKYTKTQINRARNIGQTLTGAYGTDTGLLILIGWNRTNPDGSVTFVSKTSATCTIPDQSTPPPGPSGGGSNPKFGGLPVASSNGSICGIPFTPITLPALDYSPVSWPDLSVTFPGDTFLLQDGSIGPKYPDIYGMLVYDTQLKKWGKMKGQYKRLLNYSPINSSAGAIIPYSTFGVEGGLIKDDGFVYLFDHLPSDSRITYGKLGYHRLGFTDAEELRASFKEPFEGSITIDGSLDGHNLEVGFSKTEVFSGVNVATLPGSMSARWYNFTISGIFDLSHLEFRGNRAGRR